MTRHDAQERDVVNCDLSLKLKPPCSTCSWYQNLLLESSQRNRWTPRAWETQRIGPEIRGLPVSRKPARPSSQSQRGTVLRLLLGAALVAQLLTLDMTCLSALSAGITGPRAYGGASLASDGAAARNQLGQGLAAGRRKSIRVPPATHEQNHMQTQGTWQTLSDTKLMVSPSHHSQR